MSILALETSTPFLTLGWFDATQQLEQSIRVDRGHAEELSKCLAAFLPQPQADIIAVGAGPGSYTGVRVAASYALGLAKAWHAKVIRVPTLEAIAARETGVVAVSLDAHRGQVYSAVYDVGTEIKTLVPLEKRPKEVFAALIPVGAVHLEDVAPSGIALAKLALQRLEQHADLELLYL